MEFSIPLPSEIYNAKGMRGHTPHVMQSSFAAKKALASMNNNNNNVNGLNPRTRNQQGAGGGGGSAPTTSYNFETFNIFNGFNENNEVLPYEEVPPDPMLPEPQFEGLIVPPNPDGTVNRTSYGVPRARRSPLLLWSPPEGSTGLTAKAISDSQYARWYYLATLRTFGFDYLKPPGISKTLKTMLEEEELSDAEEESLDIDPMNVAPGEAGLEPETELNPEDVGPGGMETTGTTEIETADEIDQDGMQIDEGGEADRGDIPANESLRRQTERQPNTGEQDEEEEEEEDLDADIEEAEDFNYDDDSGDEYNEEEYEGPLVVTEDYQQDEDELEIEISTPSTNRQEQQQDNFDPRLDLSETARRLHFTPNNHDRTQPHGNHSTRSSHRGGDINYDTTNGNSVRRSHGDSDIGTSWGEQSNSDYERNRLQYNGRDHIDNNTGNSTTTSTATPINTDHNTVGLVEGTSRALPPVRFRHADDDGPRQNPRYRPSRPSLTSVSVPSLAPPLRHSSATYGEFLGTAGAGSVSRSSSLTPPPIMSRESFGTSGTLPGTTATRRRVSSNRFADSEYSMISGTGPESPETPGRRRTAGSSGSEGIDNRRYSRFFFHNYHDRSQRNSWGPEESQRGESSSSGSDNTTSTVTINPVSANPRNNNNSTDPNVSRFNESLIHTPVSRTSPGQRSRQARSEIEEGQNQESSSGESEMSVDD